MIELCEVYSVMTWHVEAHLTTRHAILHLPAALPCPWSYRVVGSCQGNKGAPPGAHACIRASSRILAEARPFHPLSSSITTGVPRSGVLCGLDRISHVELHQVGEDKPPFSGSHNVFHSLPFPHMRITAVPVCFVRVVLRLMIELSTEIRC